MYKKYMSFFGVIVCVFQIASAGTGSSDNNKSDKKATVVPNSSHLKKEKMKKVLNIKPNIQIKPSLNIQSVSGAKVEKKSEPNIARIFNLTLKRISPPTVINNTPLFIKTSNDTNLEKKN